MGGRVDQHYAEVIGLALQARALAIVVERHGLRAEAERELRLSLAARRAGVCAGQLVAYIPGNPRPCWAPPGVARPCTPVSAGSWVYGRGAARTLNWVFAGYHGRDAWCGSGCGLRCGS